MAVHPVVSIPTDEISIRSDEFLGRVRLVMAALGIVALVAGAVLGAGEPREFFASYLTAFLFYISIGLGGLFFVLIQFATRAGWSVAIRRQSENLMFMLPLCGLFFLPLVAGMSYVYPWLDAAKVAQDPILLGKQSYLNVPFFLARSLVYVLSWAAIAYWFRRRSLQQDEQGDPRITRTLQNVSAPAIVWFAATVNFAAFDWIMSLDPHWYSTVFGVYFFAGIVTSSLSFLILMLFVLLRRNRLSGVINDEHFHDLGKLLFGFVVFWAYIAFSQFMLIWYGNLPEETIWFAQRWRNGWQYVSILLAVGHFVIPFFVLLSRGAKRNRVILGGVAVWMLLMHYLDLYWLVAPAVDPAGPQFYLPGLLVFLGLGGLFLGMLIHVSMGSALVPTKDPRLAESLSFENI